MATDASGMNREMLEMMCKNAGVAVTDEMTNDDLLRAAEAAASKAPPEAPRRVGQEPDDIIDPAQQRLLYVLRQEAPMKTLSDEGRSELKRMQEGLSEAVIRKMKVKEFRELMDTMGPLMRPTKYQLQQLKAEPEYGALPDHMFSMMTYKQASEAIFTFKSKKKTAA